jgi:hypothetical protein
MGKKRRSRMMAPILEDADMEEMWGGVDGLDQLITQQQIMDLGKATVMGGGSALVATALLNSKMLTEGKDGKAALLDTPIKKGFAAMGLGFLGGWGLWRYNRDAAIGLASGMSGLGLATVIGQYLGEKDKPMDVSLSGLGDSYGNGYNENLFDDDELSSSPTVMTETRMLPLDSADDEELIGFGADVSEEELADAVVEDDTLGAFLT